MQAWRTATTEIPAGEARRAEEAKARSEANRLAGIPVQIPTYKFAVTHRQASIDPLIIDRTPMRTTKTTHNTEDDVGGVNKADQGPMEPTAESKESTLPEGSSDQVEEDRGEGKEPPTSKGKHHKENTRRKERAREKEKAAGSKS